MAKPVRCLLVLTAHVVSGAFILLAVFAPAYHRQRMSLPGGSSVELVLSLFESKASGECRTSWGKGRASPLCLRVTNMLNNRSLREVVHLVCGLAFRFMTNRSFFRANFISLGVSDLGCTQLTDLSIASNSFLVFLGITLVVTILALVLSFAFFTSAALQSVRKAALASQLTGATFHTIGLTLYCVIGGTLQPTVFFGSLPLFHNKAQHDTLSYGAGLGVALISVIQSCCLPAWGLWGLRLKDCSDYVSPYVNDRMSPLERQALLTEIEQTAREIDPDLVPLALEGRLAPLHRRPSDR